MIRGTVTIAAFVSAILFPWLLTALLMLIAAVWEPLVPLAVGIFVDTLYYSPSTNALVLGAWPWFTIAGAIATVISLIVHSRLRAGTMYE